MPILVPRWFLLLLVTSAMLWGAPRVRIGVESNVPPLSYVDEQGRATGFTPEFLREMERTGAVEFEIVPGAWTNILRDFNEGRLDALANVVVRAERRSSMDFSIGHAFVHGVVYFKAGHPRLQRTADFQGKRIAVLAGSIGHTNAMENHGWGATIVPFSTWTAAMESVQRDECDAGLFIRSYRKEINESFERFESEYVEDIIHEYRIGVHKGQARTLESINDAIAIVRSNGKFDRLYAQWIGPLEPHPIRLADLRPYVAPALLGLAAIVGIFWWQRVMLVRLARRTDALRASEERWKFAIEGAGDAVLDVNLVQRTVVFSQRWAEMLGYREEEIGHELNEWNSRIHPDDRAAVERGLAEHLAGRTPTCVNEHRLRCRDGSYVWVLSRSLVVSRSAAGEPLRMIGTHSDITERKQNERALREATAVAEESARLKSQFLANVSHEIRTPLNGVLGAIGLLLDSPLQENQRSLAGIATTSAQSLLTIINDILDFSRIEAGQLVFERTPFDVREPVESSLELLADRAAMKGIELVYLLDPDVNLHLVGDAGRLRQVLLNLTGNAVKFTDRGEVVVHVRRVADERDRVRLRFEVRDTGIGILPEHRARLFQPFVQADGSTTRKYGGSGLGLAICRQLVGLMGGELGFESEPGCGSTFWFTAEFQCDPALHGPDADPLPSVRALVVDDHAVSRDALQRQLTALGVNSAAVADADAALAILRREAAGPNPFELAIIDRHMADTDGVQLAGQIRAEAELANVRTVLLTSIREPLTPEVIESAGVSRWLVKPVRHAPLREALSVIFRATQTAPVDSTQAPDAALSHNAAVEWAVAAPPRRILVAEDNRVNQLVIRKQLEKLGYSPVVVENGALAVAAIEAEPFDVVFMDCQMPELDGLEATRRIRVWETDQHAAGSKRAAAHIIALTAHALTGDREQCLAAGMNDYLSKPVRTEDLQRALSRAPRGAGV